MSHAWRPTLILLLLGAWLGLTVATWAVAVLSFGTVDALAGGEAGAADGLSPGAAVSAWRDAMAATGSERELARLQAAELNRAVFTSSSRAQLVLAGLALFLAAWPGGASRDGVVALGVAALLVALIALFVVPQAGSAGRAIGAAALEGVEPAPEARRSMGRLHAAYAVLDLVKVVAILHASTRLGRALRARPAGRGAGAPALALLAAAIIPLAACTTGGDAPSETNGASGDAAEVAGGPGTRAGAFSAQGAWEHLEAQWSMGPRAPGLPAHSRVQRYIAEQLEAAGAEVRVEPFRVQVPGTQREVDAANISGLFRREGTPRLLLGAHYDTRPRADLDPDPANRTTPIHGANDGGSGVAVLLEIARVLAEQPAPFEVELLFFDVEDLGRSGHPEEYSLGSRHLVSHWPELRGDEPLPSTVVVVDMVGDADLEIRRELQSARRFPDLTEALWEAADRLGHDELSDAPGIAVTDDHVPFLERGVPSALLIDLDYPYWHTTEDTIDKCSPASLAVAGRVVLDALIDEPERQGRAAPPP